MNFVINDLREKSYNTIIEKAEKLRVSIHSVSTGVDSMDVDHPDDVGLVDLSTPTTSVSHGHHSLLL